MNKKTILIVDDDQLIREGLKTLLENEYGYKVIDFTSGVGAIPEILEKKPHIDAAILDIIMPGGHGGSIEEQLKKIPEYQDTIIIYYTGLEKSQIDNKVLRDSYYINKEGGGMKQVGEILKKLLEK